MTSLTDTQVVTASGGLVELGYDEAPSSTTVTASAAATGHIVGEVTFVADGSPVLVEFSAGVVSPPTATASLVFLALEVDGSVTRQYWVSVRNSDGGNYLDQSAVGIERLTPAAGSHTIRIRAWQTGGTNGVVHSGGNYAPATTRVSKIVQATQWPAVTTGTIICTSSTRPASPFEGQKIYETDTDRELTYDSSAWVQTNSLGGWSTWTPQLYQNGNLTSTTPHARYTRIGDTAIVQAKVSATAAGTAGNQIEIRNLPYSAEAAGDYTVIGNAIYWDGTLRWQLNVETLPTATSIAFGYDSAPFAAYGGGRFGASPSKAVASGNFISFTTTYEIA